MIVYLVICYVVYSLKMASKQFKLLCLLQLSDSEKQSPLNGIKPLSSEQEELIHRLVYYQNEYEHPPEEDVKRIMVSQSMFTTKNTKLELN